MAFISTSTPLAANATWTSKSLNPERNDNISGLVFANQTGTLFVEQSSDNTNWDLSKSIAITASTGQGFSEPLLGSYVRLRYVNGSSAQTAFRLSARFTSAGDS